MEATEKATKTSEQTNLMLAQARTAAEEAGTKAEEAARKAQEAAEKAMRAAEAAAAEAARKADEAMAKVDLVPKLVRQILGSRHFLIIITMVVLGSIMAAVAVSAGLTALGP
jgi:hypothetical protein